jgi:hypothetical protein
LHPHGDEQPFTRSQSKIKIPPDVTIIRVRAHDLVDGFGGEEVIVDITIQSGPGFEIKTKQTAAYSTKYSPHNQIPPVDFLRNAIQEV